MLTSQKIARRQSEIREKLAHLAGIDSPTQEQRSEMAALDGEYGTNEQRYRAALIGEAQERRSAADALGDAKANEWGSLVEKFELRQAMLFLDEGRALDGATAEVAQEMRSSGGYQGVPIPLEALEQRSGETVAAGVVNPVDFKPIIARLFPDSVAARMGANLVNIGRGTAEYPVTSSAITAGWAATETGDVAGPTQFTTASKTLKPHQNLGVQVAFTRRALLASAGIEDAARNDIRGAIQAELDKAVFLGTGASGQPLGVVAGQATYGYGSSTATGAKYADFRAAIAAFMLANAAGGPGDVRILFRPEVWDALDGKAWDAGSGISEYDRLTARVHSVVQSGNAMATTGATSSRKTHALLTTTAGGLAPFMIGVWGGVDLIRDPYSGAASGAVKLTALLTADVTVARNAQLHLLKDIPIPAA
ncbi:MAG: phage major capsid protein [Comamonadaceae bacterium]|nr:phage major capsid protein [Comamonadaceae bacterium]